MRVAGYARVSTEEQKVHGVSIADQEQALARWAEENGHEYLGCYNDAGISARSRYTKRTELLRLLNDIRAHKVDLIIFTKLDRWFRNVADYYEVQRVLDENSVAWKAIREDYETETASGRLKVNIMLSVAQDEADRTSERLRQTNEYRWAAGEVVQKLPTGYKRDGKKVIFDEATRPAMQAFFQTYLDTGSLIQSMDAAALLGVRLTRVGAGKMLRNPFFTGTVRGISVPAYITPAEFEQIQRRKAMFTRATKKKRVYLFSGLLTCGSCGGRLHAQSNRNTFYYVCGIWLNKSGCSQEGRAYINEQKLECWLLSHLDYLFQQEMELARSAQRQKDDTQKREALTQRLERIKLLFINGDIEMAEYRERKEDIEQQLRQIRRTPVTDIARLENLLDDGWHDLYEGLSKEGRAAFWHRTLQQIIISPNADPGVVFQA